MKMCARAHACTFKYSEQRMETIAAPPLVRPARSSRAVRVIGSSVRHSGQAKKAESAGCNVGKTILETTRISLGVCVTKMQQNVSQ